MKSFCWIRTFYAPAGLVYDFVTDNMTENLSVITLICGLPGSGKSHLVNAICQRNLFPSVDEGLEEDKKLTIPTFEGNLYVINYDELIPVVGQMEIISTPGEWKKTRRDVICAADAFICHAVGLPFSSQLSDTAAVYVEKLIQSNKERVNSRKNAFLIDDNFYYQSMRHEWYLLAKKLSMGFCQIYLECPPEVASSRNCARKTAIPNDVIHLMAKRIEAPNQNKNPWEKNSLCINVGNQQESLVNKALIIIEESLKNPLRPEIEGDVNKENAKRICSTNVIHQIDIILRHLTGEKIKKLQALHGGTATKKYSKHLNGARRDILKALKQGNLTLSKNLRDIIECGTIDDSELQNTITALFESSIYVENIIS